MFFVDFSVTLTERGESCICSTDMPVFPNRLLFAMKLYLLEFPDSGASIFQVADVTFSI